MEDSRSDGVLRITLFAAALTALMCFVGYRMQRTSPGTAAWISAQERAKHHVAAWSIQPRAAAELMIERYGPPDRKSARTLTWTRAGAWRRVVAHREPTAAPLEHAVSYDVPSWAIPKLMALDHGLSVPPEADEISVRGPSESLNLLALNLADEVVIGVRTSRAAREFYDQTVAYSAAGKSTPYLERLQFDPRRTFRPFWEGILPSPMPIY